MFRFPYRVALIVTLLLATLGWAAGPVHQAHAATATVACSQTAVQAALAAGGSYTFAGDCTLVLTATFSAGNTTTPTTLDGNGHAVVFDGNNATQILRVNGGVTLTLVHLTLRQGNAGSGTGGAVYNNGALTVTASTLVSNTATSGGAVYNNTGSFSSGFGGVTIGDTLFASNTCAVTPGYAGVFFSDAGHNLSYNALLCPGSVSGQDPLLGPLANNGGPTQTLAVGLGSPAIGAGDPTLCGPVVVFGLDVPGAIDQRGVARTLATCTIGAYEYQDVGGAPQSQTITFTALPNKTYGDSPFDVSSDAAASSGLTVSFRSATTGVCTVSGSTVTIVSAGTCTIDADQAGNGTYAAASQVQQSFTVARATPIITWSNPTGITYGTPLSTAQLDATASVPGSFTYTPASGTVLNAGSGQTLSVSFTPTDATTYRTATGTATIDVTKASQAIGFSALSAQLSTAAPFAVSATGGASGNPVTFAASPSTVCTAGGTNGSTMTIVGVGTCTVTASQAGTTNYLAAPDVSHTVTVTAPQQSATLSVATASGSYGGSADLSATLTTGTTPVSGETLVFSLNGAVVCGSSTPVICPTTDATGIATLAGVNLSTISAGAYATGVSARFAGDSGYVASSGSNTLTVSKANQAISVQTTAPSSKVYNGTFSVAATSDSGLTVSYGSSGGCTNNGATYTMTSGTADCTVTFDQVGNTNYNAATQVTETVTATKALATITLSNLNQTYDGSAKYATATTTPSGLSGVTITYAQGNTAVSAPTTAGSYSVDASLNNANYTANDATGTLVIAQAPLTITASSPSMTYGGTVPAITPSYSGFVNGETTSSLTPAPTCTTTATSSSNAGTYPTSCSGAIDPNYTFSYTSGTLTITKATLTVTPPSNLSVQYSDALPALTPAITGYVLSQDQSVLTTAPTCTTTATTASFFSQSETATTGVSSPAGSYAITCSGGSATNYTFSYGSGSLTVTPEDAAIQDSGTQTTAALPSSGSATIPLIATVWDSAAKGYSGSNAESASSGTIGDITQASVVFDVYPAGSCLSGSPAYSLPAPVTATGTSGVGTATASFSQSTEGSFCVVARVTGGYYTAPEAQVVGIAFYVNNGQFVTGGGRVADSGSSTGQGTFGFNARYNKQGSPKGQMMYSWEGIYGGQAATFTIASNALSSLSFSGTTVVTATLQGKVSYTIVSQATGATLYTEGNDSFSATVIDGDSGQGGQTSTADSFALSTFQSGNTPLHPVSGSLTGGNVVAHNK